MTLIELSQYLGNACPINCQVASRGIWGLKLGLGRQASPNFQRCVAGVIMQFDYIASNYPLNDVHQLACSTQKRPTIAKCMAIRAEVLGGLCIHTPENISCDP